MTSTLLKVALRKWQRLVGDADLYDCRIVCSAVGLQAQDELEGLVEHFDSIEELHTCYQGKADESLSELGSIARAYAQPDSTLLEW